MSALSPVRVPSGLERARELASDALIVAVVIYSIPLAALLVAAVVRLLTS
jgi:hypothetical protein